MRSRVCLRRNLDQRKFASIRSIPAWLRLRAFTLWEFSAAILRKMRWRKRLSDASVSRATSHLPSLFLHLLRARGSRANYFRSQAVFAKYLWAASVESRPPSRNALEFVIAAGFHSGQEQVPIFDAKVSDSRTLSHDLVVKRSG